MDKKINGLFIDTTNNYLLLSLLKNNEIIEFYKIEANRNLTSITHKSIDDIFKKNKIDFRDIENIFITTGPGSFTGVRIGITIVKAWNAIYKFKNIYAINGLKLLQDNDKLSAIDARSKQSFVIENNKIILKDNSELEKYDLSKYKDIDKNNLWNNLSEFNKLKNIDELKPTYIKKVI